MTFLETLLFGRGIRSLKPGLFIYNAIMVRVEDGQLLTQSRFVFAQGIDATPNRRHMLAKVQGEALYETRVDLPTPLGQDRLNDRCRTEDGAVFDSDDALAPADRNSKRILVPAPPERNPQQPLGRPRHEEGAARRWRHRVRACRNATRLRTKSEAVADYNFSCICFPAVT